MSKTSCRSTVDDERADRAPPRNSSCPNLRREEGCYSSAGANTSTNANPLGPSNAAPTTKTKGQARRLIKSISNTSLRNLAAAGNSILSNGKETKKNGVEYRPRSRTLETLEKQTRDDGPQYRPRTLHPLLMNTGDTDRAPPRNSSCPNLRGDESCYSNPNANPLGPSNVAPATKTMGQARRLIKSISNTSLRNLAAAGNRILSNGKETKKNCVECRPRSRTLETLEKQLREEGPQYRPRIVHPLLINPGDATSMER